MRIPVLIIAVMLCLLPGLGRAQKASSLPPGAIAYLPAFTDGPGSGRNAVFNRPLFDAEVGSNGQLAVYPKDNEGRRLHGPVAVGGAVYVQYYDTDEPRLDARQKGRRYLGFCEPLPPPQTNARSVTIKRRFQDDVIVETRYAFSNNAVSVTLAVEDPPQIKYPSVVGHAASTSPARNIPTEMEQSERVKLLKDCLLRVHLLDPRGHAKWMEYKYAESAHLAGYVDQLELLGHYAPRKIVFKTKKGNGGWSLKSYAGTCPWEGFGIFFRMGAGKKKTISEPLLLSVE